MTGKWSRVTRPSFVISIFILLYHVREDWSMAKRVSRSMFSRDKVPNGIANGFPCLVFLAFLLVLSSMDGCE